MCALSVSLRLSLDCVSNYAVCFSRCVSARVKKITLFISPLLTQLDQISSSSKHSEEAPAGMNPTKHVRAKPYTGHRRRVTESGAGENEQPASKPKPQVSAVPISRPPVATATSRPAVIHARSHSNVATLDGINTLVVPPAPQTSTSKPPPRAPPTMRHANHGYL